MLVGATVLSVDSAEKAVDAGEQYIVAQGLDTQLVECSLKSGKQSCPGMWV